MARNQTQALAVKRQVLTARGIPSSFTEKLLTYVILEIKVIQHDVLIHIYHEVITTIDFVSTHYHIATI